MSEKMVHVKWDEAKIEGAQLIVRATFSSEGQSETIEKRFRLETMWGRLGKLDLKARLQEAIDREAVMWASVPEDREEACEELKGLEYDVKVK